MAEYIGKVKLGCLRKNGSIIPPASLPWPPWFSFPSFGNGNLPPFSGAMAEYSIGNTPTNTAQAITWVKIKDGSKTLLISDRCILGSVSWNALNTQGWVSGKRITIDGAEYMARLLTGGSDYRPGTGGSNWAGGFPVNNEWDRFINREEVVTGLPAPVSSDLNSDLTETDYSGTHNQFWNWVYTRSWCQDIMQDVPERRASRGHMSARYWDALFATDTSDHCGWRPVLEVLNTAPTISDTDRNLGDKDSDFVIPYSVNDADAGDTLTVTEALDGITKKSFSATRNQQYSISIPAAPLSLGIHTMTVTVTDGKGGTAARTWTFRRINKNPTISGSDTNLGDKNIGFTYPYTVDDADMDTLTVTEQLNAETLRVLNNAPRGEALFLTITPEKLYALGINAVNTIKITVSDGKGGVAYRQLTFKRSNSAPIISGQDADLGLQEGIFAENYSVSDIEGDRVIVAEFVDDRQIRSYEANLGEQQSIELSHENWILLPNGNHQLRIEAADESGQTAIRVFNFQKHETVIAFQLTAPEETDARATKILITPMWQIGGAVAVVEACNNAFDSSPTWEDITPMVMINRPYNFTNESKAAEQWGINVRFTITKNEGYEGEAAILGFGGAYE